MSFTPSKDLHACMSVLGYTFRNINLLEQALTHSSYAMANHKPGSDNERMEYLGDAVLELIVSRYLYDTYSRMREGDMTRFRARLVCEESLYEAAVSIGLPEYISIGFGEEMTGGRDKPSILSDAFEAVLCAIYLDGGLEEAKKLVERTILVHADRKVMPKKDPKTALQETVYKADPHADIRYVLVKESGPDHMKQFTMEVLVNDEIMGEGTGRSKQAAGQQAAEAALEALRQQVQS